jgi:ankyrin repeat protein
MTLMKKIALGATIVFACVVIFFIWLFVAFWKDMSRGEEHGRQLRAEQDSGRADFGDQPVLFAVAQGIVENNQEKIVQAAKALPDLQAPGKEGTTLLYFAVTQSWRRPELLEAVKTLLSLKADPNYTNGQRKSYAMANAVHASAAVLQAMLDAGGNPNTRNEFGEPIVIKTWYLGYYKNEDRTKLAMLLDRGADINSTLPENDNRHAGYSLLLDRSSSGGFDNNAYADAQFLLERGADPARPGTDGMTFAKMLIEDRARYGKSPPAQFTALWDYAVQHGLVAAN